MIFKTSGNFSGPQNVHTISELKNQCCEFLFVLFVSPFPSPRQHMWRFHRIVSTAFRHSVTLSPIPFLILSLHGVGQRRSARGSIQHGAWKPAFLSISNSWFCRKSRSINRTNSRNRESCNYCCRIRLSCI